MQNFLGFSRFTTPTRKTFFFRGYASESQSVTVREPIDTIRRDLVQLIDEELKQIKSEVGMSQNFLAESKFKIQENELDVTLIKTHEQTNIKVEFQLPKEDDENLDLDQDQEEDIEKKQEGEAEGEGEAGAENQAELKKLAEFTVTLELPKTTEAHTNKLVATCTLANDYRTYIESLQLDDSSPKLFLEDLAEELRERIYDYFGALGIDDKLGNFVVDYREEYKVKTASTVLDHFKNFLGKPKGQK
jgi:hypothetical protein